MTDKKITDKDIIKALECLCGCALKCRECPYSPRYAFPLCQRQVAKDALDLITRQQAEIESLKENRDELWEIHCRDTERCLERIDEIDALKEELKTVKSEAVKAFAERLKKEAITRLYSTNLELKEIECVEVEDIDYLVKEMVGD